MAQQKVLVIDDEPDIRELLEITLLRMGLDTATAGSVKEALLAIQSFQPDLCLTDMKLPDGTGLDIVRYIQRDYTHIPVAVITAFGSMESAVEALKAGAYDFVSKPVDLSKLRDLVQTALTLSGQIPEASSGTKVLKSDTGQSAIIGESEAMKRLNATIIKLARSQAPVFIHGESGSGKELVANEIHNRSPRAKGSFTPVNCGAIPENLMESEFFGHKKGSFTGAVEDKKGLFQAAHKGTLFLDEVADLPLGMQVKLLRAIQEKAIKPVGGTEELPVDIRILSATHKDLEKEVEAGNFRQDLYYRLNVIKLDVPPLHQRGGDIELLAHFFLKLIAERWELPKIKLSDAAMSRLNTYPFPGNVRELENILERASTLCEHNVIQPEDLQLPETSPVIKTAEVMKAKIAAHPAWQANNEEDTEKSQILEALEQTRWNRTAAAKQLGMTFRQLRYRIKKYELDDVG
ncbi:MAG: sigma-54-dependent transcriptional regulator [Leucothrix sp.]